MSIYRSGKILLAIGTTVLLASCDKNELTTSQFSYLDADQSQVKVVFASPYQANPGIQIKLNDQRVSSILSYTATGNPTPFPGGGLNTGGGSTPDYLSIPAKENKISVSIPFANTANDSVPLATSTYTYEAGRKYSLYFTDTSANTTSVLVVDSLTAPDSGFVKYKFVNLIPDLASADLYIGTVKVASDVPYKGVSASFILPTNNASSTWAIRSAGSATNLATYPSAASITANQRVLTIIARGYSTISTSTDSRKRAISLIYNL